MPNSTHLRLVAHPVDRETIHCLRELLVEAECGKVIGLVYAAMYGRKAYSVDSVGQARLNPTFSRGMLLSADDELARLISD